MKLTEKQAKQLEETRSDLANAREELRASVITYNEAMRRAGEFVGEVAKHHREKWDARSERWRDSERGQTAATWVESWESAAEEFGEELDEPEEGALEELEIADEDEE